MKRIMFVTLILLLFVTCSGVWAGENVTDEIIAESNPDDCIDLQSSQVNDFDQSESGDEVLKSNDSDVEGQYVDASEAYEYLNAFRTEENVWYWNSDDATQSHVNTNDTVWLKPLKRDIELENTAKIRAKELSEYFSHTRPDGSICFTIFPEDMLDYGENIAEGYENSFDVTEGWKETDLPYEGQGHRRNMLVASYNCVGIAGYKINGTIYWVQNFGCRYDPEDVDVSFTAENNTLNPKFSINLPKHASGSFDVYVNGILINSKSVSNGKADITVCGLNPGKYEIFLSYSGDYNCNPLNRTETVIIPDYETPSGTLTFNCLNTIIQMAGDEVKLENDYAYNPEEDSLFLQGITISKQLTIDGQGHTIDGKNLARVFKIIAYGVTLKNIRLINGNAILPVEYGYLDQSAYGVTSYYYIAAPSRDGGAIYSYNYLSLVNSTFSNNNAFKGGAIYCDANVNVENCGFIENSAGDDGGAIFSGDYVSLKNTSFTDNRAVDLGAAVYTPSTLEAENSIFKNNYNYEISAKKFINNTNTFIDDDEYMKLFANATIPNGIVSLNRNYNASGTVFITASNVIIDGRGYTIDAKHKTRLFNITGDNVTIRNLNFINGSSVKYGGAIYISSPTITIINSTFANCIAQRGGVIYGNLTDITVINSSFTNNAANDFADDTMALGGAICTGNRTVCVINSSFIKNTAFDGGAIRADYGPISIFNSYFESNSAVYYGGGAVNTGCDVNIMTSTFKNNYASTYGGAVFCWDKSKLNVGNSTFENNTCDHYGGAISAAVWAEIADSLFTGNSATDYAGVISIWGNLSITNSNFTKNSAAYAGVIFDHSPNSIVSVTHSNFVDNTQKSHGVLYIENNAFVSDSSFINNHAYDGVGGAIVSNQNLTVSDSVFKNNSVVRSWGNSVGGAIINYGQNLNVVHSTFTDNCAHSGGAIISFAGNVTVDDSFFKNNSAYEGGACFKIYDTGILFSNSNFEDNRALYGGALYGCDAFNCTFTQNNATGIASAMYGSSNTAEKCTFIKNIDYNQGPTFDVDTSGCTFRDNRIIVTAGFDSYYVQSAYYQGETLYISLFSYQDGTFLENVTVTVTAYKNTSPAGEFEFLSGDGWPVNITEGNYTLCFAVKNPDYIVEPLNVTLTVIKKEMADVQIAVYDNTFLDPTAAEIKSNTDGTVSVYIDDFYMEYLDVAANRTVQLTYNYISVGNHTLKVIINPADYRIDSKTFSKNFKVLKKPTSVTLNVVNTKSTENVIIGVNASEYGNVIVRVGDIEESVYVSAGIEQQISFGVFKTGKYVAEATFVGDENYMASNASKTFKVLDTITQDEITISRDVSGNLSIALPGDATGTVTVSIAGNDYNAEVAGGVAEVVLPDSLIGENSYVIAYSGDEKYSGFSIESILNGDSSQIKPDIVIGPLTEDGRITLPSDATGTVTLTVDGEDYVFDVADGIVNVILPDLANGIHQYTISYSGDGKYMSFAQTDIINVERPVIISAGNAKLTYGAVSYYTITVKNDLGIAERGADVVIYINSKKFTELNTDSKGMCSFKVSQGPGTYNLKITSKTKTVTKTLTVKHLLTLKSVTVKRSAKKLVLTATLGKINNKYLKNKKITFKFNGKKYTGKTNKKGVAKVTVKSSVLKKLKVGKKVTYQATYLKDTVKKTAKIKK